MGKNPKILPILVPLAGLEPARMLLRGILSPLRLPIPPQRRGLNLNERLYVATEPYYGGATQIRTGGKGFADPGLTTWRWRLKIKNGAGNEIRTRDIRLGKATLYH